jgi:hypothetical protein
MLRRTISVAVVAALLLATAGAAQARSKHRLTATAKLGYVSISGVLPTARVTLGGTLNARPGGKGTLVSTIKYGGYQALNVARFTGTFRAFEPHGSLTGRLTGTATAQALNKVAYAGTVTVTGGTDLYAGATGKLKFTGGTTLQLPVTTLPVAVTSIRLAGTLTY